jgi:hypothetical protein
MCKFIIVKTLDGKIFRKGAAFCENGMKGMVCIDTQKIFAPPNPQTILIKSGNATVTTSSITSIMIENLLELSVALIETNVISPQLNRFMNAPIQIVEQMYLNMKKYGDLYPPSVESPAVSMVDSVQTSRVSRSSRVKIEAPSTVAPSDSISQVSRAPLHRPMKNDDESIIDWIEKSSDVSTNVSRTQRSSRSSATMKAEGTMVSSSTSRGSSRRMSSYAMARQMTIRE